VRGSVLGSTLAHVAVVGALFAWHPPTPVIVPGPDIVQVALVDPTQATPQPTPPAPAPVPEKQAPEIKPEDTEGVKLTKPKPEPKKVEPAPRTPPPSSPTVAVPYAKVGSAGLSGSVAVDQRDFEFTYYLLLVRNRVAAGWAPPAGAAAGTEVVVYFKIGRGGDVSAARLETSSGSEFFDKAALRAVLVSDPMPPLPLGWNGDQLGVHFGFQYTGP